MNGKSVKIKVASDKKAPSICYLIGGVDPKLLSIHLFGAFVSLKLFKHFLILKLLFLWLSYPLFFICVILYMTNFSTGPEQDPEQGNQEHLTFTRKEVGGEVFLHCYYKIFMLLLLLFLLTAFAFSNTECP